MKEKKKEGKPSIINVQWKLHISGHNNGKRTKLVSSCCTVRDFFLNPVSAGFLTVSAYS